MATRLDLVSLIVDDYDRAIAFFVDVLGFELAENAPTTTTEGREKRWVVVRTGPTGCGLLPARADGHEQEAAIGQQLAGRVGLFLRVRDFDGTLQRVVNAGCDVVRPMREEPYGRVFVFQDPWGNLWDLLDDSAVL